MQVYESLKAGLLWSGYSEKEADFKSSVINLKTCNKAFNNLGLSYKIPPINVKTGNTPILVLHDDKWHFYSDAYPFCSTRNSASSKVLENATALVHDFHYLRKNRQRRIEFALGNKGNCGFRSLFCMLKLLGVRESNALYSESAKVKTISDAESVIKKLGFVLNTGAFTKIELSEFSYYWSVIKGHGEHHAIFTTNKNWLIEVQKHKELLCWTGVK